ncbi:ubiquitin C-terminal hydrolase [Xylona heveae TC161]|uniref:Ubiquitin C-terminal hydrolase n=1 Tax=Xylona heveae (strain CBS 132557 / TC161) TaxID=1328760 RepID=A0A165G004_XYLHT|nr:ubiquitin C-terminal hydrolase [Xylona heveae TC161]KZF21582.1 ubiquitin C-terminal hydrolase [Xylona heveae TC161]
MDGQDVMSLDSVEPDRMAAFARSAEAGGEQDEPRPEFEAALKRKRPRVDSGERDRSVKGQSAERNMVSSPEALQSENSLSLPQADGGRTIESPPTSSEVNIEAENTAPPTPTSNRMTINVRTPLPESSAEGTTIQNESEAENVELDIPDATTMDVEQSTAAEPNPFVEAVAASPSSARSPQIEAAELEDMDQNQSGASWAPIVNVFGSSGEPMSRRSLIQDFPNAREQRDPRDAVLITAQFLEKGNLDDGFLLVQLKDWFGSYLQHTEPRRPDFWEVYLEERDFWDEIPSLFECLLRRRIPFGDGFMRYIPQEGAVDDRQCMVDFFRMLPPLAARAIEVDIQTLLQLPEDCTDEPDLISYRYLLMLQYVTRLQDIPLWTLLYKTYSMDIASFVNDIGEAFVIPQSNGMKLLARYTHMLSQRLRYCPRLGDHIMSLLHITRNLVSLANDSLTHRRRMDDSSRRTWHPVPEKALDLFRAIDEELHSSVGKQTSSLSMEFSKDLIHCLGRILCFVIHAEPELAHQFQKLTGVLDQPRESDLPDLVSNAWKFDLLRKYISEGRMELRVLGIETMQVDLVNTFSRFRATEEGPNHPVMQYLSNLIIEHKLLDYIVGVESHPQLIARSANIIGFLVVTNRYTTKDSDTIWRTVETSQDPRVVAGILTMLKNIFNVASFPLLIYLCTKLNELPLDAFDAKMIDFGVSLFHHVREAFARDPRREVTETPPYDVCIRLIRQATAFQGDTPNDFLAVTRFATEELAQLIQVGPSEQARRDIYRECVQDIADKSAHATGSICAINVILRHRLNEGIEFLSNELNLTKLFVAEMAHTVQAMCARSIDVQTCQILLAPRLELLSQILLHAPETISNDLGDHLWDSLFAQSALHDAQRNAAWTLLCEVTGRLDQRNVFIDRCIDVYAPQLNPNLFTGGFLHFIQQGAQYKTRMTPHDEPSGDGVIEVVGAEQLWRIILTAPENTIENAASQLLVSFYLDSPAIRTATISAIERTHIAVVDRAILQLTLAAARLRSFSDASRDGDGEPMVVLNRGSEQSSEELRFGRSLMFLREILHAVRARPQYSPLLRKEPEAAVEAEPFKGNVLTISYQVFNGSAQSPINTLQAGDMETLEEFHARLTRLIGVRTVKIINGGQMLDVIDAQGKTLQELKIGSAGLLLLKVTHGNGASEDTISQDGLSALEIEALKHFDELYDLLDLEDGFAFKIFDFITTFPPHERIRRLAMDDNMTATTLFPSLQPYKVLYSVKTLEFCLSKGLDTGYVDHSFILRGVNAVSTALLSSEIMKGLHNDHLKLKILGSLVSCLSRFLKEPVPVDISATYFSDTDDLVSRIISLMNIAKAINTPRSIESIEVFCQSFETLIEASLHNEQIWASFTAHADIRHLIEEALLKDGRESMRSRTAQIILGVCSSLHHPSQTSCQKFSSFFWSLCLNILPQSLNYQDHSRQLFDVSLVVFRSFSEYSRNELDLDGYVQTWGDILLDHQHYEFVGRNTVDSVVLGFTSLLNWCVQLAKSCGKPFKTKPLMEGVFESHLFPDLSPMSDDEQIEPRVPVLDSASRKEIYQLILSLSQDRESYQRLVILVEELASQDSTYESPTWNFERSKAIRSPAGYAGLKNLSNTCYLNSLFTQLFMNVPFRQFMLNTSVADEDGAQRLLAETKKIFAYMQESWSKWIDPTGLADSIRTYDNEQIDVTIQMDVDEFYNLLFDRWEGQMLSQEDKQQFKSFFGGQLVQQVKSKECAHISEREEPFSAIQCDIKGKTSLEDSLKAYVEGEIMEGDNKYSCTSCNRHVNAVKRTCLRDVPNNLIFHLKRFDFDLVTMQRSKINDYFEFPNKIDMSPYKIEHLSDPGTPTPEDLFELTGVLVHSGTAESGHYYSYIRESTRSTNGQHTWVEFNDADVSRFDPAKIPEHCFGGLNDFLSANGFQQVRFPKAWSAYMLFYRRASSTESSLSHEAPSNLPVRVPFDLDLSNHIALENELFIRKYCLFDPAHAPFVRSLLQSLLFLNKGICSKSHELERAVIFLTLSHIDQVVSRTKDLPDFDSIMSLLFKVLGTCPDCCNMALQWIIKNPMALRNMLMRNPSAKVRQDFAELIVTTLGFLRDTDPGLYGLESNDPDSEETDWIDETGAFYGILSCLADMWAFFDLHMRAWDDYFGLLCNLASLGTPETLLLLQEGFFARCLEVLTVEYGGKAFKWNWQRMLRLLEKGKEPSYNKLIELVRVLLRRVELVEAEPAEDDPQESTGKIKYRITNSEDRSLTHLIPKTKNLAFLTKILDTNQNADGSLEILTILLRSEPQFGLLLTLYKTIMAGIAIDPASLAAPYLDAAVVFCGNTPEVTEAREIVIRTASDIDTIGSHGGEEHLQFFRRLSKVHNPRLPRDPQFFLWLVVETSPSWAPHLLLYWEETVRRGTVGLLQDLIFQFGCPPTTVDEQFNRIAMRAAKNLGTACMRLITSRYLEEQEPAEAKLISAIVQVMNDCRPYWASGDAEGHRVLERFDAVLEELLGLTVEEADEAVSEEWDNESNSANDSDVDPASLPVESTSP